MYLRQRCRGGGEGKQDSSGGTSVAYLSALALELLPALLTKVAARREKDLGAIQSHEWLVMAAQQYKENHQE